MATRTERHGTGPPPRLRPLRDARWTLDGELGRRLRANEEHWLLVAPDANPAMLQLFRDRDRRPVRDLLPWSGEFAGKYLTSAALALRLAGDERGERGERLRRHLERFVRALLAAQDEDGYLGVFPRAHRLTGTAPRPDGGEGRTWDAWNHYHCLLGLLLWYDATGDGAALEACRRIGDLFCRTFLDAGRRLGAIGSEERNLAPIHGLCLLYERTGVERYLRMARAVEADFEAPPAGDYVRTALAGTPFHATPKPRWESLHCVQGVAALYDLTGDERYRRAVGHIWWSIAEHDRHPTGGFSSGERAVGNPYDPGAIETCCTIAWAALSIDALRLTGDPLVADELELSTLNAVLGAQSPTGRWWTYNTPVDGVRRASAHDIVFQAREGSPELNCCAVNGPRGLGLLSEWGLTAAPGGVALHYYGPGSARFRLPSGARVTLAQATAYPADNAVSLSVSPERPASFALRLRIPAWSRRTRVRLNGRAVGGVQPGSYATLERRWAAGDRVDLEFDFSLRVWVGEREAAGTGAVFRGPLLLAYDQRFNALDPDDLPELDPALLRGARVGAPAAGPRAGEAADPTVPLLTVTVPTPDGDAVLADFASCGAAGNPYRAWLPLRGLQAVPFSRANPLRTTAL